MEFSFGDHQITVHLFGATITSWKYNGKERLFLSSKAILDGSRPIRGGIPIVFPQFGTGPAMPGQHGFARRLPWIFKSVVVQQNSMKICLQLCNNEETLKLWPHEFILNYYIVLNQQEPALETKLEVVNIGKLPFSFQVLLHTYFILSDVSKAELFGQFPKYYDKVLDAEVSDKPTLLINITGEIDRIYGNVEGPFRIIEKADDELKFEYLIESTFDDLVVWNPWIDKAKAMPDFEDDEYKRMVCLEPGNVISSIMLVPGESWQRAQKITVLEPTPC